MKWISVLLLSLGSLPAFAGFVELGGSVNYRSSGYDKHNYINSLTYTASVSYYFWEMCAWELNYTFGQSNQSTKGPNTGDTKTVISDNIDMTSLDLVLTLAERQAPFRPYVKAGAGYLIKERFRKNNSDAREKISQQEGVVPSGGLGFSFNITKDFSIKLGVDAWTSPMNQTPVVVDYAGRAGVSFMF